MAYTAHKDPDQVREFEVDEATLDSQAKELAEMIRSAKHFIAFTGAGVSTSAGIPDFRGPEGVWTLRAKGQFPKSRQSTLSAVPTKGHMALVALEKAGLLKFLISQNTDGLHRRSGFPPQKLAELHGNSNLEKCKNCGREYLRDFHTRNAREVLEHQTNRKCPKCDHVLYDTIINFSESLPEKPLRDGFAQGRQADLCLVLGSSLTVSPANGMPEETVRNGGNLVVCNLQKTHLDENSKPRIFAKTDALMEKVMKHLNLPIPEWVLRRWVHVELKTDNTLEIRGIEPDGTPATVLRQVDLLDTLESSMKEPFTFRLKSPPSKLSLRLHFMGNYNEPWRDLELDMSGHKEKKVRLEFRLSRPDWDVFEED